MDAMEQYEALLAQVRETVTPLHIERGRQMRTLLEQEIGVGFSRDESMKRLAEYLGIERESVELAVAIANEADAGRL